MGFFGIESESTANETVQNVSDQGRLLGRGSTFGESGSLTVGQGGKFNEGIDFAKSKGAQARIGSTEIGDNVTITTSDPELLSNALNKVTELSNSFSGTLGDLLSQTQAGQADQLSTLLEALGQLSSETEEEGKRDRTILWLVLGVLALLAFVFFPRRK